MNFKGDMEVEGGRGRWEGRGGEMGRERERDGKEGRIRGGKIE